MIIHFRNAPHFFLIKKKPVVSYYMEAVHHVEFLQSKNIERK